MNNKNEVSKIENVSMYDYMVGPFRMLKDRIHIRSFLRKRPSPKNGDGHPVVIIPDYFMDGKSVKIFKKGLDLNGYRSYVLNIEKSIFCGKNYKKLSAKVKEIFSITNESISLIGTGIGGIYVRLLAQEHGEKIRQIILFQTPFNRFNDYKNIKLLFSFAYRGGKIGEFTDKDVAKITKPSTTIPTTMFYCKTDDTIAWETCVEKEDELHQTIEFKGEDWNKSFIQGVYPIIFDRLQYDKNNWKRYESLNFKNN